MGVSSSLPPPALAGIVDGWAGGDSRRVNNFDADPAVYEDASGGSKTYFTLTITSERSSGRARRARHSRFLSF
eukprot:3426629-Pyramimonas_sp.AAC.1